MEKFLKNKKIRKEIKELIEPHEIFLDALVQKKEIINFGISEKKLETPINQKTSYILLNNINVIYIQLPHQLLQEYYN